MGKKEVPQGVREYVTHLRYAYVATYAYVRALKKPKKPKETARDVLNLVADGLELRRKDVLDILDEPPKNLVLEFARIASDLCFVHSAEVRPYLNSQSLDALDYILHSCILARKTVRSYEDKSSERKEFHRHLTNLSESNLFRAIYSTLFPESFEYFFPGMDEEDEIEEEVAPPVVPYVPKSREDTVAAIIEESSRDTREVLDKVGKKIHSAMFGKKNKIKKDYSRVRAVFMIAHALTPPRDPADLVRALESKSLEKKDLIAACREARTCDVYRDYVDSLN